MERKTFENLTAAAVVKKFPKFYETPRYITVRFKVLMAATMNITALWKVTRYSPVANY